MIDLNSIRELKQEYRIGTKAALDYLRVQKAYEDLRDQSLGELGGKRDKPSIREVANLCRFVHSSLNEIYRQRAKRENNPEGIDYDEVLPDQVDRRKIHYFVEYPSDLLDKFDVRLKGGRRVGVDYKKAVRNYCRTPQQEEIATGEVVPLLSSLLELGEEDEGFLALASHDTLDYLAEIFNDRKDKTTEHEYNFLFSGFIFEKGIFRWAYRSRTYELADNDGAMHFLEVERRLAINYIVQRAWMFNERLTDLNFNKIFGELEEQIRMMKPQAPVEGIDPEMYGTVFQFLKSLEPKSKSDSLTVLNFYRLALIQNRRFLEKYFQN